MSWICPKCETENPDRVKICEVCETPRESSPVDELKSRLIEKYGDAAYKPFIRYHYNLIASADQGNSVDQYKVGVWFFNKYSADCYKIATIWFLAAAKQGHITAQSMLALCYEEGYGVPKSKETAIKWYKKAALEGDEIALHKYLKLKYSSKTYEGILRYRYELLRAADSGNSNSQYLLGKWFSDHNSQSSYKEEAFFWYEKSAKNGYRDAMFKLGECYENGIGVYCNYNEAIKWYTKAAKGGNDSAQLRLVKAYLYGFMVNKDVNEALKWYELVGTGLDGADLCNIGYAYDTGDTIMMNKFKAVEFYRKAAEKGDSVAQYNMGVCYENGNGVSIDNNVAKYWYEKAASQGYSQAVQCVSRINSKIHSEKQDEIISYFITSGIGGAILGVWGYYRILVEALPNWGVQIPEVWPNTFPSNLIICIIIGFIIVLIVNKV